MANLQPVLIAGGGIGGLAAALGLAQKGIRSILLEKAAVLGEIGAAVDRAEADGAVVLLAGRPGRFSGGFDLPTLTAFTPASADLLKAGFDLSHRLLSLPRPVVVACTGHAIAMGSFLVLSGDHRIGVAGGAHKIGATEVAIGMAMLVLFGLFWCWQWDAGWWSTAFLWLLVLLGGYSQLRPFVALRERILAAFDGK